MKKEQKFTSAKKKLDDTDFVTILFEGGLIQVLTVAELKATFYDFRDYGYEFFVFEPDRDALAKVLVNGGRCVSLNNVFSFDKDKACLVITHKNTHKVVRRVKPKNVLQLINAVSPKHFKCMAEAEQYYN